ncbi:MAG: hypothetical protein CME06_13155 [Gemmatimonadetes bacterium]|nr:hypothetical protein [Gemmatimonadota bacterium]
MSRTPSFYLVLNALLVISVALSACAPAGATRDVRASYAVAIGDDILGESNVLYRLAETEGRRTLSIEAQTKLEGAGVTVYDSTRVLLDAATHLPIRSRKIVLAGTERKYANAVYQDEVVIVTSGTPRGVFPIYVPRDTVMLDKEQLNLGLGLTDYGRNRPTILRALSADAQSQLRVAVRDQGEEEITTPSGTHRARKVRMGVRRHRPPTTFDYPEHEVFLWYGADGRLLRYHDAELEALWLLKSFEGDLRPLRLSLTPAPIEP